MEKINGTLVILTKNEIVGIKKILPQLPTDMISEILCIDGKSKDGTPEFLRSKGFKVVTQKKLGRGEAFRIASKIAKYEHLIFFSPDGNEDPKDILKIFSLLEKGYDMVIASRFMKQSRADDEEWIIPYRGFGNRAFTRMVNLLWHAHLTDTINGFRGIKKSKFLMINPDAEGFGIEYQLSIRALKLGFKIKEIPTYEGDRIGGRSTLYTMSTGFYFLWITLKELFTGTNFRKKK